MIENPNNQGTHEQGLPRGSDYDGIVVREREQQDKTPGDVIRAENRDVTLDALAEKLSVVQGIAVRQRAEIIRYRRELVRAAQQIERLEAGLKRHKEYKKQHRDLVRAHRLLVLEHKALSDKIAQNTHIVIESSPPPVVSRSLEQRYSGGGLGLPDA